MESPLRGSKLGRDDAEDKQQGTMLGWGDGEMYFARNAGLGFCVGYMLYTLPNRCWAGEKVEPLTSNINILCSVVDTGLFFEMLDSKFPMHPPQSPL